MRYTTSNQFLVVVGWQGSSGWSCEASRSGSGRASFIRRTIVRVHDKLERTLDLVRLS